MGENKRRTHTIQQALNGNFLVVENLLLATLVQHVIPKPKNNGPHHKPPVAGAQQNASTHDTYTHTCARPARNKAAASCAVDLLPARVQSRQATKYHVRTRTYMFSKARWRQGRDQGPSQTLIVFMRLSGNPGMTFLPVSPPPPSYTRACFDVLSFCS